jgi:hypothetical protein
MSTHVHAPSPDSTAGDPRSVVARLGAKRLLHYLLETLRVEPLAPLYLGFKRCIKAGAALDAGLQQEKPGQVRTLTGRYLLYACFQLDMLVDDLPDYTRALYVRDFVHESLGNGSSTSALIQRAWACRELSLRERLRTVLLVWNLRSLTRTIEALLDCPTRQGFFRQRLTTLVDAVVEDMNLESRGWNTLESLAPSYPAMGLSSLDVLLLLKGQSLEEIASYERVLGQAEQLARLEDDILEVWMALEQRNRSDSALEDEVDYRNLVLRHARNLGWPMRAALDEACRQAGEVEHRLAENLGQVKDPRMAVLLRRVATFFPTFADALIGPHRVPAPARSSAA